MVDTQELIKTLNEQCLEIMGMVKDRDKQIESLSLQLSEIREATIEEICASYYQPIIDNYKTVQASGEVGRFAHENDIRLYERLIKGLRSQEWVNPTEGVTS